MCLRQSCTINRFEIEIGFICSDDVKYSEIDLPITQRIYGRPSSFALGHAPFLIHTHTHTHKLLWLRSLLAALNQYSSEKAPNLLCGIGSVLKLGYPALQIVFRCTTSLSNTEKADIQRTRTACYASSYICSDPRSDVPPRAENMLLMFCRVFYNATRERITALPLDVPLYSVTTVVIWSSRTMEPYEFNHEFCYGGLISEQRCLQRGDRQRVKSFPHNTSTLLHCINLC